LSVGWRRGGSRRWIEEEGYPFETPLPSDLPISGVILADHARSLDWAARRARFICRLPDEVVEDVTARLVALVSGE
jgi:mRNA interferase MazF